MPIRYSFCWTAGPILILASHRGWTLVPSGHRHDAPMGKRYPEQPTRVGRCIGSRRSKVSKTDPVLRVPLSYVSWREAVIRPPTWRSSESSSAATSTTPACPLPSSLFSASFLWHRLRQASLCQDLQRLHHPRLRVSKHSITLSSRNLPCLPIDQSDSKGAFQKPRHIVEDIVKGESP